MAAITTTGTLTAGNSRTFALAPGSALTLTLLPNCRVTVTETPETVSASDAGGNSPRTHNHQFAGVFTYGPYVMGGSVVVDNASNSGSTVTWGRKDTTVSTSSDGLSLVSGDGSFLIGPVASGAWMKVLSLFRLRITGTGTLQMDSKDSLGNITLATFPLTSYTGATDTIEFPYAGDDAVAIRVTLTGTLTCEVI